MSNIKFVTPKSGGKVAEEKFPEQREGMLTEEYLRQLQMKGLMDRLKPKEIFRDRELAELEGMNPRVTICPLFGPEGRTRNRSFTPFVFDIEQSKFLKTSKREPVSEDLSSLIQNLRQKIKSASEFVDNEFVEKVRGQWIPENNARLEEFFEETARHAADLTDRFGHRKLYLQRYRWPVYGP